jgi:fibro-slime domain-containing protein
VKEKKMSRSGKILFVLLLLLSTGSVFSQITVHVLNPWANDANRKLYYIRGQEPGNDMGTLLTADPARPGWLQYTFRTTTALSNNEISIASPIPTIYDPRANRIIIPIGSLASLMADNPDAKDVWITFTPLNKIDKVTYTAPTLKLIYFFNPWNIGVPWINIKTTNYRMFADGNNCGWFKYPFYDDIADLSVYFMNSISKIKYGATGMNATTNIPIANELNAHDSVWIYPISLPNGAPQFVYKYPSIRGDCNPILLATTIRDKKDKEDGFNMVDNKAVVKNMVMPKLDREGKPIPGPAATVNNGATNLDKWFRPISYGNGFTNEYCWNMELKKNENGMFEFNDTSFYPADSMRLLYNAAGATMNNPNYNLLLGTDKRMHNQSFTMELECYFEYQGGEKFYFTGDDDVWVFIDSTLRIDLGGTHEARLGSDSVSLDNLGLTKGKMYNFKMFFCERYCCGSNCKIITSINLRTKMDYTFEGPKIENGVIKWSMTEKVSTEGLNCTKTAQVSTRPAQIEYWLEGPAFIDPVQLAAGVNYGGITISNTAQFNVLNVDTSKIALQEGKYRIKFFPSMARDSVRYQDFTLTGPPPKPNNEVENAYAFADNGIGQVNRVELYYASDLEALPDSLHLSWPSLTQKKTVLKSALKIDPANKKHLTVTVTGLFNAGETGTRSPDPRGTSFWYDTLYKKNRVVEFPIKDNVGPLVTSATLLEREGDGDDTLLVSFSESIQAARLIGTTVVLVKSNGTKINLDVKAQSQTGDTYKLIVAKLNNNARYTEQDSIGGNPTSTLMDALDNKPNINNKPVKLIIKRKPGQIANSAYFDSDADGKVDMVRVRFDREVSISDMSIGLFWDNNAQSKVDASRITPVGSSQTEISLEIPEGLRINDKTSGPMGITVVFNSTSSTRNASVADSAAPVLVSVNLHPGLKNSTGDREQDTLIVRYSEDAKCADSKPLNFFHPPEADDSRYQFALEEFRRDGYTVYYKVDKSGVNKSASGEDSVYIRPAAKLADNNNVIQANNKNKRVLLIIKPIPVSFDIRIGPNPFFPDKEVDTIKIVPTSDIPDHVNLKATIKIFDSFGNQLTGEKPFDKVDGTTLIFTWNGKNRTGRIVGAGTYIGLIKVTDTKTGKSTLSNIKIGVKRQK